MKVLNFIFFAFITYGITFSQNNQVSNKENPTELFLNTDTKNIHLTFNDELYPIEIDEANINFPFNGQTNSISFISPTDTIEFSLPAGKSIPVNFIIQKKDTTRALAVGLPNPANFSENYIIENTGTYQANSPEVHELLHIAISLTKYADSDNNLIRKETTYYNEVISFFEKFSNHPLIEHLDENLAEYGYSYYYNIKMNSCMYSVNEKKEIVNKSPFSRMSFGAKNWFEELIPHLENFMQESNFSSFYSEHSTYYRSLIETYYQLCPIQKMWDWLEKKSPQRYDAYKIYFSPLVGGAHSTKHFSDNNYSETTMFVSAPIFKEQLPHSQKEMQTSRIVFTEIDHNYVNPISKKLTREIEESFNNRFHWVLDDPGLNGYSSSFSVFNEYMTWALFSLYCIDNFKKEDAENYISKMEKDMVVKRGFIKFREFNQELIAKYSDNKNISLHDLTKAMLKWAKHHQENFE